MRHNLYRDIIHGQIRLLRPHGTTDIMDSEQCLGNIVPQLRDTDVFQRLRSIRQNGLTNFVFATTEHSRFTHSMGVFEMSRRVYDSVIRNTDDVTMNEEERTLVAVAGLLHDVGHGPFSHAFEKAFNGFDHEQMTLRVLEEHPTISKVLSEVDAHFANNLKPYISKDTRADDKWTYRIVSSQLDADRLDYMLRDSLLSGLRGHGFDLDRLLDVISTIDGKLVVEESSMPTVEAYLISRLHLYEIVYFHKTVRAAQCMLTSIFKRCSDLIEQGDSRHLQDIPPALRVFLLSVINSPSEIDIDNFSRIGDHHCWTAFDEWARSAHDAILRDLCKRFVTRRPFKARSIGKGEQEILQKRGHEVFESFAQAMGIEKSHVLAYYIMTDTPKIVTYQHFDPDKTTPEEEIWLRSKSGAIAKLSDYAAINPVIQAARDTRTADYYIYPADCTEAVNAIMVET